jgi:hypothetical protein
MLTNEGVKVGLEVGHEQGRTYALAGEVSDAENELPVVKFDVVVVISADSELGPVNGADLVGILVGELLGNEHGLHLGPQIQVCFQSLLLQLPPKQPLVFDGHRNHVGDGGNNLRSLKHILLLNEPANEDVGNGAFLVQHGDHLPKLLEEGVGLTFNGTRPLKGGQSSSVIDVGRIRVLQANVGGHEPYVVLLTVPDEERHFQQAELLAQKSPVHVKEIVRRYVIVDGLRDLQQSLDLQLTEVEFSLQAIDAA